MSTLPIKFETLPEDIRAMLQSDEFVEKIELIGEKQSLPPMEQGFLVRICAKLVTGVLQPANFVNTIADELDISREKAAFIAQEINRDIFSNIKESLKTLHRSEQGGGIQSPAITPVATEGGLSAVAPTTETPQIISPAKESVVTAPVIPAPLQSTTTTPAPAQVGQSNINTPQRETIQPHIGSIFEQKLGGEFRLKSDAVTYTNEQGSSAPVVPPTTSAGL